MVQRSQNGYRANDRSLIGSISVPGGHLAVRRGDVATVMRWVATVYNNKVQKLIWPGCWGYAERTIRGSSTTLSNHASGTAIDLNAPLHPIGTAPSSNYNGQQIHTIRHDIVAPSNGVIRWGGDYHGRKDGMHFEINASPSRVAAFAAKIRGGQSGGSSSGRHSKGILGMSDKPENFSTHKNQHVPKGRWRLLRIDDEHPYTFNRATGNVIDIDTWVAAKGLRTGRELQLRYFLIEYHNWDKDPHTYRGGDSGKNVEALQRFLNEFGKGSRIKVDGDYGPATKNKVETFQRQHKLSVDGIAGNHTLSKLRHGRRIRSYGAQELLGSRGGSYSLSVRLRAWPNRHGQDRRLRIEATSFIKGVTITRFSARMLKE